jgi:hypothetical protein
MISYCGFTEREREREGRWREEVWKEKKGD